MTRQAPVPCTTQPHPDTLTCRLLSPATLSGYGWGVRRQAVRA